MLICAATPSAALTGMFAEKFARRADPAKLKANDREAVSMEAKAMESAVVASKLVSVSTVLSLLTMPLVALLLQLLK